MPVQPGTLDSLQDQLLAIVESLRHTMQHVDQLVVRLDKEVAPELTATLKDARKTLDSAERMLGSADKALVSDAPLQRTSVTRSRNSDGTLCILTSLMPRAVSIDWL